MTMLRSTIFSLFAAASAAPAVHAFEAADPFGTRALVAAAPAGSACRIEAGSTLDLERVLDLALCNHPQTRQAWASARAQAAAVGSARAAYLPNADASLSARWQTGSSAGAGRRDSAQTGVGLSLSYLLYDFGGRDADLESARQRLAAANADRDDATQRVLLAAVQAFYQWHAAQATLEAARVAETTARESFNAASARVQVGVGTPLERLQAQSSLSQATLDRVRAEGDLANARAALANAMGVAPQTPFTLGSPELPPVGQLPPAELEALLLRAQSSRPDLAAAEAQWRAALAGVDRARAQGRPSVSVSAGQDWSHNSLTSNSDGFSVGVTVNVPLFSGFADTYRVRAAEASADASRFNRDLAAQQAALEVVQAFNTLNTEAQSVSAGQDLLGSAEEAFRVASGRYRAGVGSMLELLTAQSELSNARRQFVRARYDWNVARFQLARAVGRIDVDALPALSPAAVPAAVPTAVPTAVPSSNANTTR